MKTILGLLVLSVFSEAFGATVSWSIDCPAWMKYSVDSLTMNTTIAGSVWNDDDASAMVRGMIFTRKNIDGVYIKAYDYSGTAAPVNTRWLLAFYGDILDSSTLSSFKNVEQTISYDYGTGGDKIANPSDFYLVFVAENWDDYVSGVVNPHVWYGWVNLAVNSDGALDILGSGAAIYGDALTVGIGSSTPEPSIGLLSILGVAVLALRRKRKEI